MGLSNKSIRWAFSMALSSVACGSGSGNDSTHGSSGAAGVVGSDVAGAAGDLEGPTAGDGTVAGGNSATAGDTGQGGETGATSGGSSARAGTTGNSQEGGSTSAATSGGNSSGGRRSGGSGPGGATSTNSGGGAALSGGSHGTGVAGSSGSATPSGGSHAAGGFGGDTEGGSGGINAGGSQPAGGAGGSGGSQPAGGAGGSGGSQPAGGAVGSIGGSTAYGEVFAGGEFHLGPVDWEETEWTNSCSPYPAQIQTLEGNFLAGLELTHNGDGQLCDACVQLDAETGRSIVARVITTGVTTPNSIDLSPQAFQALDSGEYPRAMTWQVVKCPDTGNVYYQFQTEANVWWTSLWVRNTRIPVQSVEVRSSNHANWYALERGSDGTYTDASGFGDGSFTLRVTAIDGQTVEDTFTAFDSGSLIESDSNFQ